MLLFNHNLLRQKEQWFYFNTSNVTIQLADGSNIPRIYFDFNTSNVTIQQ